jgi:hypothetical protein
MKLTTSLSSVFAVFVCSAAVTLAACGAASDGEPAEADSSPSHPESGDVHALGGRPESVPLAYRVTPVGYLHPSCVIEARPGEHVSESGDLVSESGVTRAVSPCPHPRFDRSGRAHFPTSGAAPAASSAQVPTIGGWLAYFAQTVVGITWQSANFKVPTAPLHMGNNVAFFFNGLQNGSELIQPVLQWNQGGYPNQWTIAAWYVKSGNGIAGPTVLVNPGDTISGYMYPQRGGRWVIGMNQNGAYATGLSVFTTSAFDTLIGGAMEVYHVDSCEDLPSTGFEFFTSISVYRNGSPFTPTFSLLGQTGTTPNCNAAPFAGTTTGGMTWLYQ